MIGFYIGIVVGALIGLFIILTNESMRRIFFDELFLIIIGMLAGFLSLVLSPELDQIATGYPRIDTLLKYGILCVIWIVPIRMLLGWIKKKIIFNDLESIRFTLEGEDAMKVFLTLLFLPLGFVQK
jgi:hypothetical protein